MTLETLMLLLLVVMVVLFLLVRQIVFRKCDHEMGHVLRINQKSFSRSNPIPYALYGQAVCSKCGCIFTFSETLTLATRFWLRKSQRVRSRPRK